MMILLDPKFNIDPDSAADALPQALRVPTARTLGGFLRVAQEAMRLRDEVTVLLTTDATIRRLNKQFRGKNQTTDVLSFPALAGTGIAGDLAISIPIARRQAIEQGHTLSIEIKVLILHGLVHLAGFDHETDQGQMARRERKLRALLKLPQGLIERVEAASVSKSARAKTSKPARTGIRSRSKQA